MPLRGTFNLPERFGVIIIINRRMNFLVSLGVEILLQ